MNLEVHSVSISLCLILQTNLQFNNNKYYAMQLLEDDSSKRYSVWFRWGRGELRSQPFVPQLLHI